MVYNIYNGQGCPYCKNKTEGILQRFLDAEYEFETQVRFDWCRFSETNNIMPVDFCVGPILIELDGEQHFSQVSNWDSPGLTRKKDVEKIKAALVNGYFVIHLLQYDVWNDIYDWRAVLRSEIDRLAVQTTTECVFLQSHSKYGAHAAELNGYDIEVKDVVAVRKVKMRRAAMAAEAEDAQDSLEDSQEDQD
jgi:hypothetical protein